jgi:hypothetical protein
MPNCVGMPHHVEDDRDSSVQSSQDVEDILQALDILKEHFDQMSQEQKQKVLETIEKIVGKEQL